jgi:GAF domain-containing protein
VPIIGAKISDEEDPHALLATTTKKVVVVNDAFNDAGVDRERMKEFNVRSVMVIPLVVKDEAIGVLFLNHHSTPATFTKAQTAFAEKLGYSLALALENAALLKIEKKQKERFGLLSDTASRLLATQTPQAIVQELCLSVMAHLSVQKQIGITEDEVPGLLKTVIFRISQEALSNIARHSEASLVNLTLQKAGGRLN